MTTPIPMTPDQTKAHLLWYISHSLMDAASNGDPLLTPQLKDNPKWVELWRQSFEHTRTMNRFPTPAHRQLCEAIVAVLDQLPESCE